MAESKNIIVNSVVQKGIDDLIYSQTFKKLNAISELEVKVNYYDEDNKKKLEKYPAKSKIISLVNKHVFINKNEFLTYLLFTEQRNRKKLRTFSDFSRRILKSYLLLNDFIEIKEKSLKAKLTGSKMDKDLIERIGVAYSLCIMNKIHDLTEADWRIIPTTTKQKTLDFRYASDEKQVLEVEAKGSALDNNKQQSGISKHKKSIIEKKKECYSDSNDKSKNKFAYGIISVLDNRTDTVPQIWLLDPPSFQFIEDPVKVRLINRLYFYWTSIKYVLPNSSLLHALINRINVIEKFDEYREYEKIHLLNRMGKKLEFNNNSFSRKSVIGKDVIIGRVFPFNKDGIFYMGFPKKILEELKDQNFNNILKFKEKFKVKKQEVKCRIRTDQMQVYQVPTSVKTEYIGKEKEYIEFTLKGKLTTSNSGRIFGILNFK